MKYTIDVNLPFNLYIRILIILKTERIVWIIATIVRSTLLHLPRKIQMKIQTKFDPKCKNLRTINKLNNIATNILACRTKEDEKRPLCRALATLHWVN